MADAFIVGLLNTLLVSAIGIVLATILGFVVGIARLSKNWMVAKVAMVYVEMVRNIPLLLQLLFWYIAVLDAAAAAAQLRSRCGAGFYLNSRGLFMPRPLCGAGHVSILVALRHRHRRHASSFAVWAKAQQEQTGRQYPVGLVTPGLVFGLPVLIWIVLALIGANPITFEVPEKGTFNLQRRHADPAGVRGAAARPRHLHRGLHRRGRPRRHPRGLEGPDGGGRFPRPARRARRCASSSSRRPCASSFRR